MMQMNNRQQTMMEEKRNGVAQILASIPIILWKAVFTLIISLIAVVVLARLFPANSGISIFVANLLTWLVRILEVTGVVVALRLAYAAYSAFHAIRIKQEEFKAIRLNNQLKQIKITTAEAKTKVIEQIPVAMQWAMQQGLNVEFEGFKATNYLSNIHTLGTGTPRNVIDANPLAQIEAPLVRLTIDQICEHIERNSYTIYIGGSLTKGLAPVRISIKGRHLKIIGASQKGKSSMMGALLEIVSRTHSPEYVQFALLDKEYQTSRLFENLPHVLTVLVHDHPKKIHARTADEVVEHLAYLLQILNVRNGMSRLDISKQPIIIVYIEEFLRLKKELKAACTLSNDKEEAIRKYTQFTFAIGQLAGLGLKMRMQLWVCVQMDYADKDADLQEAMINITSGLSFCVRQTAAHAAGFYQTELLARNAQENKPGQAVCEMPDCNDLILAPEYNLEKLLIAREKAELQQEQEELTQGVPEHYTRPYLLSVESQAPREDTETPTTLPAIVRNEKRLATLTDAIEVWNEYNGDIGRPTLETELKKRGFDCSEDRAKKLIKAIKERLPIEKAE